ncbi:MAG: helix-turn-helix domain-containing protein [Parvularculaceae bacterium]|nr:helix-turn-helix domain-containing protein [Parvularculaceae bacterium]
MSEFEWGGGLSAFYRKRIVAAARDVAALACGVSEGDVRASARKSDVAFARQLAMYLCHVAANMSLREISNAFGRDRTTVSHACHAIEDRRDCPTFDRQIELLEKEFRGQMRRIVEEAMRAGPPIERKSRRYAG